MSNQTKAYPFQNPELTYQERAADLVSRFTLDEKIESMVQYQPAIPRLGVKPYKHGTEAAHGMAWLGEATSFPQPIGLGCTWNPELMKRIGAAIGDEARVFYQRNPAVNGLTLWAPTVDMERDPRWGRTEEAYGEDPVLTGELTAALVQGIQGDHPRYFKAVATLKHFIGNNNEINRGSCSASIDPRNMKEYYQAAFKPAFVKGGARSLMTSYNSVNGTPTIVHEDVQKVVKGEWGMDGFIVSDAGDLLGLVRDHAYYETYKEAVAHSIKAGIDSITDEKDISCAAIREALEEGLLAEGDLDRALTNTFGVRFRLGEFDPEELVPYANTPEAKLCAPEHAALSFESARESVVLLKNEGGMLPLDKRKLKKTAVIGPLADVVYRDWYSGTLPYSVTPLGGIKRKLEAEGGEVAYCSGNDRIVLSDAATGDVLKASSAPEALVGTGGPGGDGQIWEATDWGWGSWTFKSEATGKLLSSADDRHIAASADEAFGWYVKEVFRPEVEGEDTISLRTWNGQPVVLEAAEEGASLLAVGDKASPVARAASLTKRTIADGIAQAVAAAASAETAIVVVGNNPLINGKEEIDRPGLGLAESQNALIRAVHEANPNTVVVVVGSYPFELSEIHSTVPAIVYSSHAGQELGHALAEVLFGDYSPAGRLNMTWYKSEEQLTGIMDYDIRKGKRTYLYFDGEPLYPFGHGLSYATFRYGGLELEATKDAIERDRAVRVKLQVTNASDRAADEVAQLYVRMEGSQVERPLRKLVAFTRLHLQPRETRQVEFLVPAEQLAIWDVSRQRFCLEQGAYTFMAGGSSAAIQVQQGIELTGEVIPPRDLSQWTDAICYNDYEGVYIDESEEGGTTLRLSADKGWIAFDDVDLTKGASVLEVRVSGGTAGGTVASEAVDLDSGWTTAAPAITVASCEGGEWQTVRLALTGRSEWKRGKLNVSLSGSVAVSRIRLLNG